MPERVLIEGREEYLDQAIRKNFELIFPGIRGTSRQPRDMVEEHRTQLSGIAGTEVNEGDALRHFLILYGGMVPRSKDIIINIAMLWGERYGSGNPRSM